MSNVSILKRITTSVLPSLLGAVVGGACILAYSSSQAAPAASAADGGQQVSSSDATASGEQQEMGGARGAARRAVAGAERVVIEDRSDRDEDEVEELERPDLEQSMKDEHAEFEGRLARHRVEKQDPAWAEPAQTSFGEELSELGESGGFSVGSVDCRARTCRADLAWPSLDSAMRSMESIATARYETNCLRTVHLAEGMDGGGEVRGTVLFECPRDRG